MKDTHNSSTTSPSPWETRLSALCPIRHSALIGQMVWREVQMRTRGSLLGAGWWVLAPMAMLAVYTMVLRHVMGVKWGGSVTPESSPIPDAAIQFTESWTADLEFALRVYIGLAVFAFFSEVVSRSPRLVSEVPHLVKKVVFPLWVLPWVTTLAALLPLAIAGSLCLVGASLSLHGLQVTAFALPLVWLPLIPLVLGMSWILSAVGPFVRDVSELLVMALGAALFLSPVFYDLNSLPPSMQSTLGMNPLAVVMTQTRDVLLAGQWPAWDAWAYVLLAGIALAAVGASLFVRVQSGFADVV